MEIPYTVEARPETGLNNGQFGMWLFVASEVMLFGALFSAYALLRTASESWPEAGSVLSIPLATGNSLVLISSSIVLMVALRALQSLEPGKDSGGESRRFRRWYGLTIGLGVLFLVLKGWEYQDKLGHGLHPADSTFLSVYFALTGFHALHVVGGVLAHLWLWGPGFALARREPQRYRNRVEVAGIYWHFVDLVWLVLFPTLYLL